MAKISRSGRMTVAKKLAAKSPSGKGVVKNRPEGKRIMRMLMSQQENFIDVC